MAYVLVSLFSIFYWLKNPPEVAHLSTVNPLPTALMQQRKRVDSIQEQFWVSLDQISPNLVWAVLVAEDIRFFSHEGFDWEGVREAFKKDLKTMRFAAGGSTLSQQLARNLYLSPSKTLSRKLKEAWMTYQLEKHLTKKRILEIYLNVAEWGRGIYGAEAAARYYFGKPASDLNLDEASFLAAILPSPRRYAEKRDTPFLRRRQAQILYYLQNFFYDKLKVA